MSTQTNNSTFQQSMNGLSSLIADEVNTTTIDVSTANIKQCNAYTASFFNAPTIGTPQLTASSNNFITKGYADTSYSNGSEYASLAGNNTFTGLNTFSVLPESNATVSTQNN